MSIVLAESLSPILRVIPDYEKQYLVHIRRLVSDTVFPIFLITKLSRGESLLATSEQCHVSCKRCVEQMAVCSRSIVSNVLAFETLPLSIGAIERSSGSRGQLDGPLLLHQRFFPDCTGNVVYLGKM